MLHWANWPMNLIWSQTQTETASFWNSSTSGAVWLVLQMPLGCWGQCVLVGAHPAVRFDFDLTHARQSPGASAGCVFTQTARRHHLMALISISFKSILHSLPSFHLCKTLLFFFCFAFFFLNKPSVPLSSGAQVPSFGGWDQTARPAVVLMGINWGAVEGKVLQNHSTGAGCLGKCVWPWLQAYFVCPHVS